MTVGQMTNSEGQLDNSKLLSKLQTVILRLELDKDKTYRPPNVEAATDYLQKVSSLLYCSLVEIKSKMRRVHLSGDSILVCLIGLSKLLLEWLCW